MLSLLRRLSTQHSVLSPELFARADALKILQKEREEEANEERQHARDQHIEPDAGLALLLGWNRRIQDLDRRGVAGLCNLGLFILGRQQRVQCLLHLYLAHEPAVFESQTGNRH